MTANPVTGRSAESLAPATRLINRRLVARAALAAGMLGALAACGGGSKRVETDLAAANINTIGVNSFLWRASLDTLSFMPLLQSDSTGGVIVTDWYANPANPGERMKVTVTILDQSLRADALRVGAAREVMQGGTWVAAPVQAATVQKLENIILTRAREMRRDALMG
ncbi:DUF3576 domain-containing protein [Croceicoccus mobilis]|uniref:DUF3576 domain-containing protein n=1 Tax=Croceicoccus mobilis TaxID=1703339 RepID=A0A916Z189_9SPHN|nr:hypothetical protein GCM10010990_21380 [Croceicoccus mobilis]